MSQICEFCGDSLPQAASTGRPRRFCSGRCREGARREREMHQVWEPLDRPVAVATVADDLAALDALVDEVNASPDDRLARAVLETRNLSHGFRSVAREVRPQLAVRAQKMATALDAAVDENFGVSW